MRLFIAIDFPEEIKQEFFELSSELMRQADAGRIIPLENYHLTLVFIGETERVTDVKDAIATVCRTGFTDSLRIVFGGVGSFKGRRGRSHTWWVGVEENAELTRLANKLADELRVLGFAIEKRAFLPHITIGRDVVTSGPVALDLSEIELSASAISLMRSDFKNGKPVYRELFSCALSPII